MKTEAAAGEKNLTLGFFISRLKSYYESIWTGIAQVAAEDGVNVLCFVGGELNSQIGSHRHWNVIYDLAGPANLDGLIISTALQNFVKAEEMAQFCARYASIPMVSLGFELEGIPSITIDNFAGLHELMRHLIDDHQYKHIAFIKGPECNPEAQIRYRAYREALQEHDIPFNADLVTPGDFSPGAGIEAIRLLLDERKMDVDAVVASDDVMAVSAWQELIRRGINVPSDVAVTGFDDTSEARMIATPLTTISQPLIEQGRQAARMLTEILHHGRTSESLLLDTRLVIRESCGCLPLAARASKSPAPSVPVNLSENTLAQQRDVVLAEIREVICNHFTDVTPEAIEEVVDAFVEEVKGRSADRFIPLFSDLLRAATTTISRTQLEAGIITKWQDMLSVLHAKVLPYKHPNVAADIEGLLHQAYILITQMAERAHSNLQVQAEASILIQSEAVRDINAASNIQQVVDVLAQSLPRLGIRTCALALYEGEPIPPQFSRLIMACDDGKRLELDPGGCLFPSEQLIPPGILPDGKLPILEVRPLVSRDTHVGFILMEMIAGHRTMCDTYEELAEQIGSAMHKALLLQQIRQSNQDLQQRAAEMVEANIQLEQFAHIVSHDLQEPLRMVAGYLELLERRYKDRLDADAREFIGYAIGGAKRMKRMIDDLLAYSRVVTNGQPLAPVDCELLIAQILSNLEVAIKEHNAVITQDPLPHVVADGTQLMGVFQNLIGNALKFHADRQPRVHISAERRGKEWVFSVCDNGIGIAPEYIERIFVIFSRLHTQAEYPGTGIGLAICKKVIERHGGRIWVESRPGEGSTFFFTLPVRSSGTTTSHLT